MNRRGVCLIGSLAAVLIVTTAVDAFHPLHRRRMSSAAWKESLPQLYVPGEPVPEYGSDPHILPNPYPWHTPTMYSGFRHYHALPPGALCAPEGLAATPEEAPQPKTTPAKTLPQPKKKL
jgi:hypothetical protein